MCTCDAMLPLRPAMATRRALWGFVCGCVACSGDPPAQPGASDPKAEQPSKTAAPNADANAPVPAGPTAASIREMTTALSSDEMDGRRPGTPGGARAVAYIIEQMTAAGLVPAGEDNGWTQRVPMRAVTTDATRTQLAFTGALTKPVRFAEDIVVSTYRAAGTHRLDDELVFVGYGITAPEYAWDDFRDVDLAGKIAVVLVGDPPVTDGRFAGDALTYYGRWSYKFEEAQRRGAKGVLVVHETEPAAYGWNVVQTSWTAARSHVPETAAAETPLAMQGWITQETAEAIAVATGDSLAAWHTLALSKDFRPRVLEAKLRGEFVTTESTSADNNVIGKLAGTRWPEQAVLITAHWDHLGHSTDPAKADDPIYNGAIDNASGIAGMLAVATTLRARAASGRPLGRSVVFIATTGEEEGLLGSEYFVDHPTVPLRDIAGVVNLDSMNVHGRTRTVQVIGPGQSTLEDVLAEVVLAEGRTVVPDSNPGSGGYFRSDHFSFARRGVPAIYVRGGSEMEDGGAAAGEQLAGTRALHYHTVDDELDPSWTFAGTLQDAATVASLVGRVADGEVPPSWKPASEFAKVPR